MKEKLIFVIVSLLLLSAGGFWIYGSFTDDKIQQSKTMKTVKNENMASKKEIIPDSEFLPEADRLKEMAADEASVEYPACLNELLCDWEKVEKLTGFDISKNSYEGREYYYVNGRDPQALAKSIFIFHGTNGSACRFFENSAKNLIQRAINQNYSVFVFQAACPYSQKAQFYLEQKDNYDLEMVESAIQFVRKNLHDTEVYVWGFSVGAVFSMRVNDVFPEIKGIVADAGFHPDQLAGAGGEAKTDVSHSVSIKNPDSRILLLCGQNDSICKKPQVKMYESIKDKYQVEKIEFSDNPETPINESGHTPHTDEVTLEKMFDWVFD